MEILIIIKDYAGFPDRKQIVLVSENNTKQTIDDKISIIYLILYPSK